MARIASTATGGYFPTPDHLVPRIAALLSPPRDDESEVVFLDPCAGEGNAVFGLMEALKSGREERTKLYACEMEASRYETLRKRGAEWSYSRAHLIHGDAFRISFRQGRDDGASVLLLNPPYDVDRKHRRLEQKFLHRFTPALVTRGVLLFVVPYYALEASAEYLATHYDQIQCFRFPDSDFEAFKQVVLFAQRREWRYQPDAKLVELVRGYARNPEDIPQLPECPVAATPTIERFRGGFEGWEHKDLDIAELLGKIEPWELAGRGSRGVLPDVPIQELLIREYPVATQPRPAHLAAAIATGIFNGARVEPNDRKSALPALLVKGVFSQEYRTIEEKYEERDKEDVKVIVQVQQPQLIATVLDLRTHKYHTLKPGSHLASKIDEMTVAGLLHHYSNGLMRVMEAMCPVRYDPRRDRDSIQLADTKRKLFSAQEDAAKACIMLLGGPGISVERRRRHSAILLGEIGSGKSTVAMSVTATARARRPLIVCPPHLIKSWKDEIAAVVPDAEVTVLSSIADIETVDQNPSSAMVISILNRETAKLTHGWVDSGLTCPKCGAMTPAADQAKKRLRCRARPRIEATATARLVVKFARQLARYDWQDHTIRHLLTSRWQRECLAFFEERNIKPEFKGIKSTYFDEAIESLFRGYPQQDDNVKKAILWAVVSTGDQTLTVSMVKRYLASDHYSDEDFARQLMLLLPPNSVAQRVLFNARKEQGFDAYYSPWAAFEKHVEQSTRGACEVRIMGNPFSWADGKLTVGGFGARSLDAAKAALNAFSHVASWEYGPECGEFLYGSVPEPRRVALAKHIVQRYPAAFDFVILDEAHELSVNADSAQSVAAQRLTSLGLPCLWLSGSIMTGLAESFFAGMMMVSPEFRAEFKREDKQRFIDRYGYRKRQITERENPNYDPDRGSNSDRIIRTERFIGNAPGVLPLFILKHLLPYAVTLHKSDLALDLPPCTQERHLIQPSAELKSRYDLLLATLVARIKEDQHDYELSGKLFGQLAELPSYLDRATADTGNTDHGVYEIRYPAAVGGALVAAQAPFPVFEILPKEQWMLDRVESEIALGRNVMVFSWHTHLLPRYARLISDLLGEKVPVLYADKVPTAKRQEWIEKNVVGKGARVMCVNPVCIQTGLNSLVHFATELWLENPGYSAIVYRQGVGRVDRVNQKQPTKILFPIYAGTLQETAHKLLMSKVAASTAADGLDPESALASVGLVADEFSTGMSIGRQLWAIYSAQSNAPVVAKSTTYAAV